MDGGARPLVICYGNRLRRDDGVAWHVAEHLEGDPRCASVSLVCCHQLTPELADDVSRASRVVLVDARAGGTPGTVDRAVVAVTDQRHGRPAWSHDLTPEGLAQLTLALFGRVPPMEVVSVTGETFALGEGLSAAVEAATFVASEAVARAIEDL